VKRAWTSLFATAFLLAGAKAGAAPARVDTVVPGKLIGYTVATDGEQNREIVLLVEPIDFETADSPAEPDEDEDGDQGEDKRLPPCPDETSTADGKAAPRPMRLFGLRPSGDAGLVPILDDLPGDCRSIDAVELDGDGRDELLLEREGELLAVKRGERPGASATAPVSVVSDPDIVWSGPGGVATVTRLGSFLLYGPTKDDDGWQLLADVELLLEGALRGDRLVVRSELPSFVGRSRDGTVTFATTPKAHFGRRLQVQRIEVDAGGEATVTDCWAGLPQPEDLLESFFLQIDDSPVLLVTTKEAGKLGLFSEKFLRLYNLEGDRSRLGIAPFFAVQSRMNLWQSSVPILRDVNADGRDDLVIGYWKGWTDDKVVLDAYMRLEDGSFETSPRTTAFNVKHGDRSFLRYGSDLDGDDLPDLLLRDEENRLLLYPGLPSPKGKRLVRDKPQRIPLGEAESPSDEIVVSLGSAGMEVSAGSWNDAPVRLVDVDGDGREEIVLTRRGSEDSPGVLSIVRP